MLATTVEIIDVSATTVERRSAKRFHAVSRRALITVTRGLPSEVKRSGRHRICVYGDCVPVHDSWDNLSAEQAYIVSQAGHIYDIYHSYT